MSEDQSATQQTELSQTQTQTQLQTQIEGDDHPKASEGTETQRPPIAGGKPRRQAKVPPNADRPPGKSLLPIARVQKIMKADKELPSCNKEAVFLISVATEEFIKRLGLEGQRQAIKEKRATIQRKDVATAVRRSDEFIFLEEFLAANAPMAAPAPTTKRKAKNAATSVTTGPTIKDALAKPATHANATESQSETDKMDTS